MKSNFLVHAAVLMTLSMFAPRAEVLAADPGTPTLKHGAELVVCPTKPTELYDIYEARVLRNLPFDLGPSSLSVNEKLKLALDILARKDPVRARLYSNWIATFFTEANMGDFEVASTEDGNHIAVPKGCAIKQLISQNEPQFEGDKRYFIDNVLWHSLNFDQRAAAILHEVIYREAIRLHQTDSVATRYFNSILFSQAMDRFSDEDYLKFTQEIKFVNVDQLGFITLHGITYYRIDQNNTSGYIGYTTTRVEGVGDLPQIFRTQINGQLLELKLGGNDVTTFRDGKIESGYPNPEGSLLWNFNGSVFHLYANFPIRLFETGNLREIYLANPSAVQIKGKELKLAAARITLQRKGRRTFTYQEALRLDFFSNGNLQFGFNEENITLTKSDKSQLKIPARSCLELDQNGNVLGTWPPPRKPFDDERRKGPCTSAFRMIHAT